MISPVASVGLDIPRLPAVEAAGDGPRYMRRGIARIRVAGNRSPVRSSGFDAGALIHGIGWSKNGAIGKGS
jgi:hypothetical protein